MFYEVLPASDLWLYEKAAAVARLPPIVIEDRHFL